jgi:hypothetical protein
MKRKKATKRSVLKTLGIDYNPIDVRPLDKREGSLNTRRGMAEHKSKVKDAVQAVMPL